MEELFERIRQYVDGHHDEMLALWEEMEIGRAHV